MILNIYWLKDFSLVWVDLEKPLTYKSINK